MKIVSSTKVKIVIEDEKNLSLFQGLMKKLLNYVHPSDLYKTTAVGFASKLDISEDEKQLIEFINEQL